MPFKDVLLHVSSYPDPCSTAAVERAIDLAGALGAHVSVLTFEIDIPRLGNALANALLDIPAMVAAERQRSVTNVQRLTSAFEHMATERGVAHDRIVESCTTAQVATIVIEHARMHDLTVIPIGEQATLSQYVAECVIFGSGRPTIVLPKAQDDSDPLSLDVVAVAWDFSRPAARAVADALPILQRAKIVRVVTIIQEKSIDTMRSGAELAKHLAFHGIESVLDEENAAGRTIGLALEDYVRAHEIDLLVMGAYGHSRLRDFILGGATKTIIARPPLPVLLSH